MRKTKTTMGHRSPAQLRALAYARAVKAAKQEGGGRYRTASAKQKAHLARARAKMCANMNNFDVGGLLSFGYG